MTETSRKTDQTALSRRDAAWALAYVPLSIAFTWPLAARLQTALAGNEGDSWQSLWGFVHVGRALGRLEDPFHTEDLWHPHGATLVFQTFDLPDAILGAALIPLVGPWAAFNLVYLWIFAACGAAMFLLTRDAGASRIAAFLAGGAYTFTTFHFGHAVGHLHIIAMQWVPLYVLCLRRVLAGGGWRWGVAGGGALVLASLASWYHLVGSFFLTLPLVGAWVIRERLKSWRIVIPAALVLGATYLALILPLGIAMLRARAAEPVGGAHDAQWFSADLEAFVFPNASQALHALSSRSSDWTGNGAENASYLGLVLVGACVAGLVLRAPAVGMWLVAALAGIVLSLGPSLHVGGRIVASHVLPYAWLERAFPLLSFMGVPVRFGFVAAFALAAGLAPSMDAIARRLGWRWALPLGLLVFVEHLPNRFVTSSFPTPDPMRQWAASTERFAVLDATRDARHLWHQTIHGKPVLGGYLTRTPERLERALRDDPIAGPLLAWEPARATAPVRVAAIDWARFDEPIVPGAEATDFSLFLAGTLVVETPGAWAFELESDDGSELLLDGARVIDNGGVHPPITKSATVELSAGAHAISLNFQQKEGGAALRAWVVPPLGSRRLLGAPDVPGGFEGRAHVRRRATTLSREAGLDHLRSKGVRFVVQPAGDSTYLVETQLGLAPAYVGEGVRIYEVPKK